MGKKFAVPAQKPIVSAEGVESRPNPVWPGTTMPVRVTEAGDRPPVIAPADPVTKPTVEDLQKRIRELEDALFNRSGGIVMDPNPSPPPPPGPTFPWGYDGIHPSAIGSMIECRAWCAFACCVAYSQNSAASTAWKNATGALHVQFYPRLDSGDHCPGGFIAIYEDYMLVAIQGTTTVAQALRFEQLPTAVWVDDILDKVPASSTNKIFMVYDAFQAPAALWLARVKSMAIAHPGKRAILTGHSLGGAIAHMINYNSQFRVYNQQTNASYENIKACVTFGSPRPLKRHQELGPSFQNTSSIELVDDPIPYCPAAALDRFRLLDNGAPADVRAMYCPGYRGPNMRSLTLEPDGIPQVPNFRYSGYRDMFRRISSAHGMKTYAESARTVAALTEMFRQQWVRMIQVSGIDDLQAFNPDA